MSHPGSKVLKFWSFFLFWKSYHRNLKKRVGLIPVTCKNRENDAASDWYLQVEQYNLQYPGTAFLVLISINILNLGKIGKF